MRRMNNKSIQNNYYYYYVYYDNNKWYWPKWRSLWFFMTFLYLLLYISSSITTNANANIHIYSGDGAGEEISYYRYGDSYNWIVCNNYCAGMEWTLLCIENGAQNKYISNTFSSTYIWIGLSDQVSEGTFVWSPYYGTSSTYDNWRTDEPNDHGTGEDCTVMRSSTTNADGWEWNDVSCSATVLVSQAIGCICQSPITITNYTVAPSSINFTVSSPPTQIMYNCTASPNTTFAINNGYQNNIQALTSTSSFYFTPSNNFYQSKRRDVSLSTSNLYPGLLYDISCYYLYGAYDTSSNTHSYSVLSKAIGNYTHIVATSLPTGIRT